MVSGHQLFPTVPALRIDRCWSSISPQHRYKDELSRREAAFFHKEIWRSSKFGILQGSCITSIDHPKNRSGNQRPPLQSEELDTQLKILADFHSVPPANSL